MRCFLIILFYKLHLSDILFKLSFKPIVVSLNQIRCQRKKVYSDYRGFGGKSINFFPPYNIFKEKLNNPEKAKKMFYDYLNVNFLKKAAWKISKTHGGWYKGSLYRTINSLFKEKNIDINKNTLLKNKELVNQAILRRINHYFNVFTLIQKNGFNPTLKPIIVEKKKGFYYLLNGHHRVAMLSILKYNKILIFKRTLFNVYLEKCSSKIK